MKKHMSKTLAAAVCLFIGLSGCSADAPESTQKPAVSSSRTTVCPEETVAASGDLFSQPADAVAVTDFAVRLLQQSLEPEQNTLLSPLSVMEALAMTANGANGETLTQMEALFGTDMDSLCRYLSAYQAAMPSDPKYRFHMANSIWIKEDDAFTVKQDFLETNQDLFGAEVFQASFDDTAVRDINIWVSQHTDEMIPEILDSIPSDAVLYLVNALAFEAEWQTIYEENQIREGSFTRADGTTLEAEMMYCQEHSYLQDENAQGFLKYYADGKYAFAALLPDEGISVEAYVASLTGEHLHQLLDNGADAAVNTAIPKFQTEYRTELKDILENMGMTDAFDKTKADFSDIGSYSGGNLFISRVLHKTFLAVDEKGTKAGAATAVEMMRAMSMMEQEIKTVYLNRPFVYMIIDSEEKLPIFIGTVMCPASS